jgi:DNA modification methylase
MYDWWNVNQVKNVSKDKTKHPCQMPLEVMKNIISTLPENKIVFDPFMGSGPTALACIELGYDFIGCEINEEYYEIAKSRINVGFDVALEEED